MHKYPAWRKEMRELVLLGRKVVQQIRILDKQSSCEVDLQTCITVEEAWTDLDTKYGNRVNISGALMDEFVCYKLTSISEESKVVEVKQVQNGGGLDPGERVTTEEVQVAVSAIGGWKEVVGFRDLVEGKQMVVSKRELQEVEVVNLVRKCD